MNDDDELEYGPCVCGHEIGEHDEEGVCEVADCPCQYYTEDDK